MDRRSFLAAAAGAAASAAPSRPDGRPDIVVILADDLGYSDIGCYGGEIETPNLDRLARYGVRFSQFYCAARCCPSRAALLTGLYPHQAGVGHMVEDRGLPAYRGFLSQNSVTLAEVLRQAGYTTLMSGKWHVGERRPHWPCDRGFDRSFSLISGASSYFRLDPGRVMALNDRPYTPPEKGFYMTDAITDHAAEMVRAAASRPRPFFLYLAYTAPHWPLHALPEDIEKYRGRFLRGWDRLRAERYERMAAMGLIDRAWPLAPRDEGVPAWDSLSRREQEEWDLRMAVYAAQVDRMDRGIGRVLREIEQAGRLDNTLVLFFSDNGGCAEENIGGGMERRASNPVPGGPDSYTSYRRPWAQLSNTPFRLYKQYVHEGGIATPAIAFWPRQIRQPGTVTHETGHLIDVMPTLVRISGARYPQQNSGVLVPPPEGVPLTTCLVHGGGLPRNAPGLFWEHQGHRAFRQVNWKLVARRGGPWELYNLADDRTELNDLAARDPKRVQMMAAEWERWAARCGVVDYDRLPPPKQEGSTAGAA
ncbi:MAG: arylsulfatase [Bryobacteraceae bacterium]|nr:arylsulfatase [Bryobacteraceae bacterium]